MQENGKSRIGFSQLCYETALTRKKHETDKVESKL